MTGPDLERSIDANGDAHSLAFQNKPCDIILRERRIPVPHKAIVEEAQVRKHIEHLTRKVSLEKPAAMTAVVDLDRRRIVVLEQEM